MNESGNQFRTTAFGGFHKQDVLEFITRTARDHREQSDSLKRSLESARAERDELSQKYEQAEEERREKAQDCARLGKELAESSRELEAARQELAVLREAAARLAELESKLPALEEDAAAYNVLKDHTATIELEAHRKAQETVERAENQAARIRGELESWARRVQSGYQLLRRDLQATVSHLSGELERGCRALEESGDAFDQHDRALATLLECQQCCANQSAAAQTAQEGQDNG